MRRPWFPFYGGEWLANTNLRRCTHEEKGVWIDLLCLLHDSSDGYGLIRWPLKEIAGALGCKVSALKGLVAKGVLKGCDSGQVCPPFVFEPKLSGRRKGKPVELLEQQQGPLWYSSRMLVDEHKRQVRAASGKPDDTPDDDDTKAPSDDAPKGGLGGATSAHLTPHLPRAGLSEPEPEPEYKYSVAGPPQDSCDSGDGTGSHDGGVAQGDPGDDPPALRYEPSVQVAAQLLRAGIPAALGSPEVLAEFRLYWAERLPRAGPGELDVKWFQRLQQLKVRGSGGDHGGGNSAVGKRGSAVERVRRAVGGGEPGGRVFEHGEALG